MSPTAGSDIYCAFSGDVIELQKKISARPSGNLVMGLVIYRPIDDRALLTNAGTRGETKTRTEPGGFIFLTRF